MSTAEPDEDRRAQWDQFWAQFHAGAWETHTAELLAELLNPGDLYVDVGAWIGPCVVWARRLGARVVAFEPDPVAFAELGRRHGDDAMVSLHNYAIVGVRSTNDRAYLAPNPKPGGGWGDSESRLGQAGVMVRTVTLPNALAGLPRPRLVTIDIEGGEVELMPVLGPWLSKRRIPVQVSCHGHDLPAACFEGYTRVTRRVTIPGWDDVVAQP